MALDANDLRVKIRRVTSSFSPAQLATLGVLGVLTVVALLAFLRWASSPTYSVLFSGLQASDTAEVVQELESQSIPHKLGGDGSTVLVPSDKVHQVRLKLSAAGLPAGGTVGYELLDKQGITTSEFRQRVDYQRAVEGELSRTLMALSGVQSATVHLAIPEERLFTEDREATRASVLLKTSGTLSDEAVQSIVHLVASSVPGLEPDGVTVSDVDGRVLSAPGVAGNLNNRQLRMTREFEQQLSTDASTMLSQVFGPGHAVVRVSAQLNFDESERETESFDPTTATAIREQTESERFTGTDATPSGVLGIDSPVDPTTASGDTEYERTQESREFGVDRVVERSKVAPGRVERLSVAVALDAGADPVPDPDRVSDIVAAALGLDTGRGDTIVVDQFEFDSSLTEAADEAAAAAKTAASQDQLLGYARTGVGALVLLLVLFFLIKGVRSTKVEELEIEDGALAEALAASRQPVGALAAPAPTLAATAAAGELPVAQTAYDSQVLALIDHQPDEVAHLLRGWLADRRG